MRKDTFVNIKRLNESRKGAQLDAYKVRIADVKRQQQSALCEIQFRQYNNLTYQSEVMRSTRYMTFKELCEFFLSNKVFITNISALNMTQFVEAYNQVRQYLMPI